MRRSALLLGLLVLTGARLTAHADELRPALLELRETVAGEFDVLWKTPAKNGRGLAIEPLLPEACHDIGKAREFLNSAAIVSRWRVRCPQGLTGETIAFAGLGEVATDVLARIERLDARLQIERLSAFEASFVVSGTTGLAGLAATYFSFGVEHILMGVDHLLFVLALILLIATGRAVLIAVTAFTVAHSVTLAAATLDVLQPPQQPIEAVIALSILFLAVELARQRRGQDSLTLRQPWMVAFGFGLLHGFGFASALREAGLPSGDVPAALLFFNVGVEAGQIAFILAVLAVRHALTRTGLFEREWLRHAPGFAIGIVAAYWTIERTATFW